MVRRSGRSRVEILVAVLIIVLGTGLLAAVIARIRSESAMATCRNNLRQLGLATLNYTQIDERLPPLADQGTGAATGRGLQSVFAVLIPYIEATPYRFDPDQPSRYHAHSSVQISYTNKDGTPFTEGGGMVNQVWRVFIDPADSTADQLRDVPLTLPDGTIGYYATGSYAANGLLPWGVRGRAQPFPGGLFNTILLGERPQVCRTAGGEEVYNLWGLGIYSPHMPAFAALTPADPPGLLSTAQVAAAGPLSEETADDRIRVHVGRQDAALESPDFATPVQIVRRNRPCDPRLPGTPHAGGMPVVMADGSVRVFGPGTSSSVFWTACMPPAPADGQ